MVIETRKFKSLKDSRFIKKFEVKSVKCILRITGKVLFSTYDKAIENGIRGSISTYHHMKESGGTGILGCPG